MMDFSPVYWPALFALAAGASGFLLYELYAMVFGSKKWEPKGKVRKCFPMTKCNADVVYLVGL